MVLYVDKCHDEYIFNWLYVLYCMSLNVISNVYLVSYALCGMSLMSSDC